MLSAAVVPSAAQQLAPPEAPGLGSLATGTLTDFKRFPQSDTARWLTAGLVGAALLHRFDSVTSNGLSTSEGAGRFFAPGETLGGAKVQLAAAVTTYGVGRLTGQRRMATVGADLVRANILTQAITGGIKLSARRGRPDGTQFSFPSGHASVSFATATVLQRHFGWAAGLPAYAGAAYVAASRIQERRHFLTDVTFGALVGVIAGRTVTIGRGSHRFALEPMAGSGGVGVAFVKR